MASSFSARKQARDDALELALWMSRQDPEPLFGDWGYFEEAHGSSASDNEVVNWLPRTINDHGVLSGARSLFLQNRADWGAERWKAAVATLSDGTGFRRGSLRDAELERAARLAAKNLKREKHTNLVVPWRLSLSPRNAAWAAPIHWASGALSAVAFESALDETPLPGIFSALTGDKRRELFAQSLESQMSSAFPSFEVEFRQRLPSGGQAIAGTQSWSLVVELESRSEREEPSLAQFNEVLSAWIYFLEAAVGAAGVFARPAASTTRGNGGALARAEEQDVRQWMAEAEARELQRALRAEIGTPPSLGAEGDRALPIAPAARTGRRL